ncbi:acyltransferase family protein [Candidatus Pelagibacter sp. Uisw_127]|uniref:acyltransferase family protein n=1 Tax=Candidatus Pelagibacter sp. Uisw_127 TaxID=3230988 RepID=UPI0039EB171C
MQIKYRPEIDGLRAISVVAVIIYHARLNFNGFDILQGGFIGVDIFFVISGYLIGLIILKELMDTNTFSFMTFYERRARRILPALFFVLIVSMIFAWIYLMPSSLYEFSTSLISSLGFVSNIFFHYSGLVYGAESSFYKPLLHTWSLSVEEQFYIFFPFFLIICFRFFKNYILSVIFIFILISFFLADWGSKNYASASFYFIHTRLWELLAGAFLAKLEVKFGRDKKKSWTKILPTFGIILIIISFILFNDKMRHPSIYTLAPIIGVMLIIWYSDRNEILTKIISTKIFVGIGLISYPLYLWHYPIFSFVLIYGGGVNKILIVISVIFFSLITYFFIENLYRKKASTKFFLISLIISLSLILTFNISYLMSNKLLKEKKLSNFRLNQNYSWDNKVYSKERIKYLNEFKIRNFSKSKNKKNILIIGNSHGEDLYITLKTNENIFDNIEIGLYTTELWCLKDLLKSNKCLTSKKLNDENKKIHKNISNDNKELINNSDVIILSTYWAKEDLNALEELIKILKTFNKKIIITSNSPVFQNDIFLGQNFTLIDYFTYKNKRLPSEIELMEIEKNFYKKQREHIKKINNKLEIIANRLNIIYLEKKLYACFEIKKRCEVLTDKKEKIYYDGSHYTVNGARYFGKKINEINWLNEIN